MSPTRIVRNAANESIVEMLEEKLLDTPSANYKHTLRKALRAIRAFPLPILTKERAIQIPGIGNHIANLIEIHLLEQPLQPDTMPEPGAILLPEEPDPIPQAPRRRRAPRAQQRSREYVPQYRSAPYGILIALYHAESSGIISMRKDDLARSAQQYSDKTILSQGSDDPSTWYAGWSSVNKTLVPKGLVARGGSPIKFSLSATGRALAERLIHMNNDVLAMGTREYRPDGPVQVGTHNLPDRGSSAASARAGARSSRPSQNPADCSQDRSQVLSQEEADMEMALALSRQFAEEDASAAGGQPAKGPESQRSSKRLVSQPVTDAETASALERKYRNGREFGAVAPGVPPSTPKRSRPASQARRRKLTSAQCDRATRAIQRLEAGGYARADCIKIVDILHAEKALPRTLDGLYQAIVKALWEAEKQDRRLGRSAEPIGLNISALGSSDDDDDIIVGLGRGEEGLLRGTERPQLEKRVERSGLPSDSGFPGSSVDRDSRTPESRPTSRKDSKDPVVVIDSDEDSVLELGFQVAKEQRQRPTSSNPQKRPRVGDVIAIDSDEERTVDTQDNLARVAPSFPAAKSSSVLQRVSSHVSKPRPEKDTTGMARMNGNPGTCIPQGNRASDPSMAAESAPEAGSIHVNENAPPTQGEECRIVLLLDSMERFRNSNTMAGHVKSPGDLLLEEGVDCEVRPLPTGDAIFVAQFRDGTEVVLDYVIERKTIEDYGASMKDGRVSRQSYLMRQANIKRRVFLLEGDLKEKEDLYNKTELHKKLAEMTMLSGLFVKHTRDIQDTVHFYASLFRRLKSKFLKQSKEMTLRERSLFPEWNDRMNTMKKSLTLEQLFIIQLCQIPGLGRTKAQAITEMGYTTPFLLYAAYKRLNSQEERDEMLNKGEHAIGSSASKAVSQLFNQRQYPTIVKPSPRK